MTSWLLFTALINELWHSLLVEIKEEYSCLTLFKSNLKPILLWNLPDFEHTRYHTWFYSELVGNLQEKLPKTLNKFTSKTNETYYVKTSCNVSNDFELSNVSEEVRFFVASIPVKLLEWTEFEQNFLETVLLLRNIINLLIKLSIFPEECKIAKLKLIFKKDARTDPKNYRPISFLPLVSKIFEKSIEFQIEDYFNKKKLICIYWSGFRTNHSTDFCLAQLIDFV